MRGRLSSMIPPPVLLLLPRRPDPLELLHRRRIIPVVPFPAPGSLHRPVTGVGSRGVGELVGPLQWFHTAAPATRSWRVSVACRGRANMYRIGSDRSIRPTSIQPSSPSLSSSCGLMRSEEHTSELQSRFGISYALS